jgi:hypothetical protein
MDRTMDTTEKIREIIKRGFFAMYEADGRVLGRLELSDTEVMKKYGPDLETVVSLLHDELPVEKVPQPARA